jgi:hypothetical protein
MGLVNLVPGRVRELKNGRGRIELGSGLSLDLPVPAGLAAGDTIDVAIRPENIRFGSPAAAPQNGVATITNHVFLGNISEYYAALPSGEVLRVQTHPLTRFAIGDRVAIEIDAAQCSVFQRDSEDAPG